MHNSAQQNQNKLTESKPKEHIPVLLDEVIKNLAPKNNEIYIDGTFGAGGYSRAILEAANCKVLAFDCDPTVIKFTENLQKEFGKNFVFTQGRFSEITRILAEKNIEEVDGMVFDIGVSSMQLDNKERGFSFDSNSRLDMRMNSESSSNQSISAFEVINEFKEEELARIIKEFGEEPKAKKIAKKIVVKRSEKKIETCQELSEIVRSFYFGYHKIDPATKTFQAIRIFVNRELEELNSALSAALEVLKDRGRLIVVSFHSLEDRMVKSFLKKEAGLDTTISRYQPQKTEDQKVKNFHLITKSAISPSQNEVRQNPRSRSAKMRVAIRLK